uniref:Uncharacterized protein n=1 Tax=Anguilla anguilla TaxID=7936 RepID=A0A0E9TJN5_ANGAN
MIVHVFPAERGVFEDPKSPLSKEHESSPSSLRSLTLGMCSGALRANKQTHLCNNKNFVSLKHGSRHF